MPSKIGRKILAKKTDDFVKISYGTALRRTIFLDKHTGDVSLTLKQMPEDYYVETANSWVYARSEAFIDSQCATELFDILSKHGLTVADNVRDELVRPEQADRYGSLYTQLTREVAKWVDRPSRTKVSNIFAPQIQEDDYYEPETRQKIEELLRDAVLSFDLDGVSEPTRVLLGMMQGALARTNEASDLPVTKDEVLIDKSACFDVTLYYLGAATSGGLHSYQEGNVSMLRKSQGGKTFITVHPIEFNGVQLPQGSLFSQANDGGWFFQRLTPFTFDNPKDARVFGSEIDKAKDVQKRSVTVLGGMSLADIDIKI